MRRHRPASSGRAGSRKVGNPHIADTMPAMSEANVRTRTPTDGTRRWRAGKLLAAAAVALLVLAWQIGSAQAQERDGGNLGVGVNAMLSGGGLIGPSVVYDTGVFHIEGLLGFEDNGQTRFDVGGRFWYHIHSAQSADFSLGGGLGVISVNPEGDDDGTTDIEIDAGAQMRAFIVPNVAVSVSLGLVVLTGDADAIAITGDLVGGAGIAYYF
jgi:hypothetical protein